MAELEAARVVEASLKAAPVAKPPVKRSHKKGQGLKARAAAEAAGLPWPPPKPAKPEGARGRGRGSVKPSNGGVELPGLGRVGADAGDQLGLLAQTRGVADARRSPRHRRVAAPAQAAAAVAALRQSRRPAPPRRDDDGSRARHPWRRWNRSSGSSRGRIPRGGAADGQHPSLFDNDAFDGAGARADAAAAMRAERDGSDPDLARLDARWERDGLDPIEMAMLRGDADEPMVMSAMDASAMDAPTMDAPPWTST